MDFADVSAWLASGLPARKGFVARFRARVKDPQCRKQLEQSGPGPEWKPVLAPPPQKPRTDNSIY